MSIYETAASISKCCIADLRGAAQNGASSPRMMSELSPKCFKVLHPDVLSFHLDLQTGVGHTGLRPGAKNVSKCCTEALSPFCPFRPILPFSLI